MPGDFALFLVIGLLVIVLWLVALTYLYLRALRHYLNLIRGEKKGDLITLLENRFREQTLTRKELEALEKEVKKMGVESLKHFQKAALVRYNPFGDTGGDQSFALALLDGFSDGVVISSLHGRSGTRLYGKPVKKGKEVGYQFSEEEKQAIKEAVAS